MSASPDLARFPAPASMPLALRGGSEAVDPGNTPQPTIWASSVALKGGGQDEDSCYRQYKGGTVPRTAGVGSSTPKSLGKRKARWANARHGGYDDYSSEDEECARRYEDEDEECAPDDLPQGAKWHAMTKGLAAASYASNFTNCRKRARTDDEALWALTPKLFRVVEKTTPTQKDQQAGPAYAGIQQDMRAYLFKELAKVHKSARHAAAMAEAKQKRQDNPQPVGIRIPPSVPEALLVQVDDLRGQRSLDAHHASNLSSQVYNPPADVREEDEQVRRLIRRAKAKAQKDKCHRPEGKDVFAAICTCSACKFARLKGANRELTLAVDTVPGSRLRRNASRR